jgi:agmatine deiminase
MKKKSDESPQSQGYSMPPEWAPHAATWLAFPHHKTDWPGKLSNIPWVFAEFARVLTQGERVRLLVEDQKQGDRALQIFSRAGVQMENLDLVVHKTNRSWTRDSMPLWVTRGKAPKRSAGGVSTKTSHTSDKLAVKFLFNGWARYRDHKHDNSAGEFVAQHWSKRHAFPLLPDGSRAVLEGGSIDVDEAGTLLTTTECLLGAARGRYKKYGKEAAEKILMSALGVRKVLWVPDGIAGDDTSGHIDDFARFAPGGKVLVCDEPNTKDENHEKLVLAQRALKNATNAEGKKLTVIKLPMPNKVTYGGLRLPASYANYYIANSAVLVPVFNDPRDKDALELIAECYPDRPTVGIYARDLVLGLGTLHCSSMQEPL